MKKQKEKKTKKIPCLVTGKSTSVNLSQLRYTAQMFGTELSILEQNYVSRSGRQLLKHMSRQEAREKYPTIPQGFLDKYCTA